METRRIAFGDVEHLYYREQKEWREGTSQTSVPLDTQILIGDLMHVTADAWLDAAAGTEPLEPITVRLQGKFPDREKVFVLGRDAAGNDLLVLGSGGPARLSPGLHARLRKLFP